jgi:hypothetical protein
MEAIQILNLDIKQKESEGKVFYHIDLGGDILTKRIWVNPQYFEKELKPFRETIGILKNAYVQATTKLNHVIKKGTNNLFFILVRCGYRGSSEIRVISENKYLINFFHYHSPRGRLGISDGVIVETPLNYVKIEWFRNGRLYGEASHGISIIRLDGSIETISDISDKEIEEILTE